MIITNREKLTSTLIKDVLQSSQNLFFLVGYFIFQAGNYYTVKLGE